MHHPKHLYVTGLVTGVLCGLISALTVYSTMQYIASQDLETTNPVIAVVVISLLVGGIIGSIVSFTVHQVSKSKTK
ncbi:MAG: hypothetical protein WC777_03405 [Candidatus Gracilibacteria bacterium]|jgi:H+/Cl- antiporter ClcA